MHDLYIVLLWAWRASLGLLAMSLIWISISNTLNRPTKLSFHVFAVTGVLCGILSVAYFVVESEVYPAGECPNCDHQVTTRYCEDCGWENDSYFERTDRGN